MRKVFLPLVICLVTISCQISKNDLQQLNGYWEIEKVVLENGETKVFSINQTVDYFTVNDSLKGFRKKLNPQLDGTYTHSNDAEAIEVYQEKGNWIIKYTTPYSEWDETIEEITQDKLTLLNQENRLYIYKRYTPISVTE